MHWPASRQRRRNRQFSLVAAIQDAPIAESVGVTMPLQVRMLHTDRPF
jgi:hypothetical protein